MSVVVAAYCDLDSAGQDFGTVWRARTDGDFHHTSIALLRRDLAQGLHVELSNSTAKHLLWGGALLGGPVFLLAPAVGAAMLCGCGFAGAGAITGHIRRQADPAALADAAGLLGAGPVSLVVVAVNRRAVDVSVLLERATATAAVDMLWGDLEEELSQDFAEPLSGTALYAG